MSSPVALTETIASEGDTRGEGRALLVLAGVFLAVGLVLLIVPGLWVGGAVMTLIGGVLMIPAVKAFRIHRRMDPGVLQVPRATFLLSSTVPAQFQRRIKRGSREVRSLTARMVLREWVRYTVGTDTRTATHDLVQHPVPIRWVPHPQGVAGELDLQFPVYPPTFEASNNKVRWLLIVEVVLADGFSEDSVVPLSVVPAILTPQGA
ncbi:MAG TPA: hypothetical protein VMM13_00505 [Euzebya sp.]|nr:hypothetical protein [Euzebya sp.]